MIQFTTFLISAGISIHGIRILQAAVNALSRGIPGVLTNLHSRLFCLCLSAKRLDPALPYLDLNAANCFLVINALKDATQS